jgi:lysophospholipase L1-like esterase
MIYPSARRAARTAAVGSGSLIGIGAAAAGLLAAQARGVKRSIGPRRTVPPYQDGRYGNRSGTSIRLALLGDSVAAGLGAYTPSQTLGGKLAEDLSRASGRGVVLINHAVVGATSADLSRQVTRALSATPHLVVLIIGANDITKWIRVSVACAHLDDAVGRLRAAGVQVIVGTCPDLGTVRPVGPPLKWVARTRSRSLALAQAKVVTAAGGFVVPLGSLLGPEFEANPDALFAPDRYHPSPLGYARLADVIIPVARQALGLAPRRSAWHTRALPAGSG